MSNIIKGVLLEDGTEAKFDYESLLNLPRIDGKEVKGDMSDTITSITEIKNAIDKTANASGSLGEAENKIVALERANSVWYYNDLLAAVEDVNTEALGANAQPFSDAAKVKVSLGANGRITILLLADIELSASLSLLKSCDFIFGGKVLTTSKMIKIQASDTKVVGGILDSSGLGIGPRGQLIGTAQGLIAIGLRDVLVENIVIQDLDMSLTGSHLSQAFCITDAMGGAKVGAVKVKNCSIVVENNGASDTVLAAAFGVYFVHIEPDCFVSIEDCYFNVKCSGTCSCAIYSKNHVNMIINNIRIDSVLDQGGYLSEPGLPRAYGIWTQSEQLGQVLCSNFEVNVTSNKGVNNVHGLDIDQNCILKDGRVTYLGPNPTSDSGLVCRDKECFLDSVDLGNYGIFNGICSFSNCSLSESIGLMDAKMFIGSGCTFSGSKPEASESIIYTNELYRVIDKNENCTGRDFEVLNNFIKNSILSQLSLIVDGGV